MIEIDLSGRSALITGGTRNVGLAIARRLALAGADLALAYRADDDAAARARSTLAAETGRRVETFCADVGDEATVEALVDRALADFGAFHVVVHNATWHINSFGAMPGVPTEHWRGAMAVNLDAAFFLTRALLRNAGAVPAGGSIVFISSGRGHGPAAGHAAYGAAKAGLNHFAAILAQDVGPRDVRVNVVSPGYIETGHVDVTEDEKRATAEQNSLRRVGQPEDVAGVVLFLASELASFVTGQCIKVQGNA